MSKITVNKIKQDIEIETKKVVMSKIVDTYIYEDFFVYNEVEFIENVYLTLLKREPTHQELNNYLNLLRNGKKSKAQVITNIRYSEDGKKVAVKLLGSKKRYLISILSSLPIFGYLLKSLITLLTLPKLIKRLNSYENFMQQVKNENNDKFTQVDERFTQADERFTQADERFTQVDERFSQVQEQFIQVNERHDVSDTTPFLEVKSKDFLSIAIEKFPYSKDKFKDFDNDELYYSLFENVFYDSVAVTHKQKVYLNYIPIINSTETPHLDIGCGRGEFLKLLKENKNEAIGIDINEIEVKTLKQQNFNVEHIDMIKYLQNTLTTFSSISALQVIEHIDYDVLKSFISLAYKKLEKNGIIFLETINPHNKVAFNSFYMDETHKRPLPPEMVAFLLQYIGFKDVKFIYTSPMPKGFRDCYDVRMNYHDYAVLGYKI